MKTKTLALLLPLLLLGVPVLPAAEPSAAQAREMDALEKFLALDDTQLDEMQAAIARVRAMRPEERAQLRGKIREFRQLPAEQRQALRQGWGQMPEHLRDGWREMMQAADEARRAQVRAELEKAAPEEKNAVRQRLVEEFLRAKAAGK